MKSNQLILVFILMLSFPAVTQEPVEKDAFQVIDPHKTIIVLDPFAFKDQMVELHNQDSVEIARQQMHTLIAGKQAIMDTLSELRKDTAEWQLQWFDYYHSSGHHTQSYALVIDRCFQSADSAAMLSGSEIVSAFYPDSAFTADLQQANTGQLRLTAGWYFSRSGDYLIVEWINDKLIESEMDAYRSGYYNHGHTRYFFRRK